MGVICNCCPKCCVSIRSTRLVHTIKGAQDVSQYAPSGYLVEHDADKCRLAGRCAEICSFGAIEIRDGKRIYHPEACMGAGSAWRTVNRAPWNLCWGKGRCSRWT